MKILKQSNPQFWSNFKRVSEVLAITIALVSWVFSVADSSRDRKLEAYRKLGDSYVKIMELCMEQRCLDCYDRPDSTTCPVLSEKDSLDQAHKQKVIYTIIVNHFEQAYKTLRWNKDVWEGWEIYIDSYLARKAFRESWYDGANTWSKDFQKYMKRRILKLAKEERAIKELSHLDSIYLELAAN